MTADVDVRGEGAGTTTARTTAPTTVVAVHGNGGGAFRFALLHDFAARTDDVELVAPNLPGFAGEPLDASIRDLGGYADWLWSRIVEPLSGPCVLLGHGIGGSIVLELLQNEARAAAVDGVILHAPVGVALDRRWFPRLMRPRIVRTMLQRALVSRLLRPLWTRRLFREPRPAAGVLAEFFDGYRDCAAFAPMFDWITADWWNGLEPASTPATLLWGGAERILDPAHVAGFERLLPNASARVVREWDHFPMLETPVAYWDVVAAEARRLRQANAR